jgi:hypothetical protein
MKVFVDAEKRCHINNNEGNFREIESDFFNGKCQAYIEGYCYDDSNAYTQIYPWKDYNELNAAQREYERELLADAENALAILLGGGA